MNGRKSTTVTVRQSGGTYHARTWDGPVGYRRKASSTNSPYFAAYKAAEKFLQPTSRQTMVLKPSLQENQFSQQYTATLVEKAGGS